MPEDLEIDHLLADHRADVAAVARMVRAAVLGAQPQLVERVRAGWHSVNYRDPSAGFVCAIFPTADLVQLVFERGAQLPDPDGLLTGTGRQVRALEFTDEADVDPETVLEFLDHALDVGSRVRSH